MRTIPSTFLAAAVGAAFAATPVAAQQAAATTLARPAVPSAPAPRPVATWRLVAVRDGTLPATVSVADSAGTLVGSYRLPGAREAQPMEVVVLDADLVLQGETTAGVLTLQLFGANSDAGAGELAGRWWLAGQSGALRGRVAR